MNFQTGAEIRESQDKESSHHRIMTRMHRRMIKANVCLDCSEQTENEVYCDLCELRHLQFSEAI